MCLFLSRKYLFWVKIPIFGSKTLFLASEKKPCTIFLFTASCALALIGFFIYNEDLDTIEASDQKDAVQHVENNSVSEKTELYTEIYTNDRKSDNINSISELSRDKTIILVKILLLAASMAVSRNG